MRVRKRFRGRAFVLIEVLFAIFLVATAAIIVAATMPISNVSRQRAQLADKAMDLCQKQIEAIRLGGFSRANATSLASAGLIDSSNPVTANTYTFSNSDSANLDSPGSILPNGSGTVEVEQVNFNLTRVTVAVNWTDNGTARKYKIGTLMANL